MLPFGIGFSEIVAICIVLLIFVGPDGIPQAARAIAKVIKTVRGFIDEVRYSSEFDEVKREILDPIQEARRFNPKAKARDWVQREIEAPLKDSLRDDEVEDFSTAHEGEHEHGEHSEHGEHGEHSEHDEFGEHNDQGELITPLSIAQSDNDAHDESLDESTREPVSEPVSEPHEDHGTGREANSAAAVDQSELDAYGADESEAEADDLADIAPVAALDPLERGLSAEGARDD